MQLFHYQSLIQISWYGTQAGMKPKVSYLIVGAVLVELLLLRLHVRFQAACSTSDTHVIDCDAE